MFDLFEGVEYKNGFWPSKTLKKLSTRSRRSILFPEPELGISQSRLLVCKRASWELLGKIP